MCPDKITVKRGCPGIFQICGQLPETGEDGRVGFIKIKVGGCRQIRIVFQPVQAGIKNQRERKVRVGRGIRGAKLYPSVFPHSGGDSYQLRTVFI